MDAERDLNSRIVYSTEHGRMCPECGRPAADCVCRDLKKAAVPQPGGTVTVRYEKKGRKGKGVTVIAGLSLNEEGLLALAKELKRKFGAGGTVKDYSIELQGDFRGQAEGELRRKGYAVK